MKRRFIVLLALFFVLTLSAVSAAAESGDAEALFPDAHE